MATDILSISKPQDPRLSLDYDALFKKGIAHIESLSGKLWTDFNAHDPGITILEVLCYAINELGYRCDFEIGDIIAPDPGESTQNDFFSLAQVASNAALTINDYRKLLIDLKGIRNAWLEKAEGGKTELHLHRQGNGAPQLLTYSGANSEEVQLKGLYKVYIQFNENPEYGDLNDNSVSSIMELDIVGKPDLIDFEVEIEFPVWENLSAEVAVLANDLSNGFESVMQVNGFSTSDDEEDVYEVVLEINPNNRVIQMPLKVRVISGMEKVLNKADFLNKLKSQFATNDYDPGDDLESQSWLVQVLVFFFLRRDLIQGLLDEVAEELAENRNLCEDFLDVYPMSLQEIGLDLEIQVEPGTDCEAVMAEVYFRMEQYLSPVIQFYSLREMLDKEYKPEEIFRGPVLNNGFIDDQELSFHQRREYLYTSDLVQEFMKIEGVKAILSLNLSRYIEGVIQSPHHVTECMQLQEPQRYLPKLNYTRSSILVDDGSGTSKAPDRDTALQTLSELKALDRLKGSSQDNDFSIPEGEWKGLEDYHSIQHEFPANYAIGEEGLAPTESDARKGQEHQLKAYLLFFEQLLADFFSQLANVRKLYAFQDEVDRTYYTQALFEVPRVKELIADFTDGANTTSWEDYVGLVGPVNAGHYQKELDKMAEDQATFFDRRTRFLDHLMARFNESFTEYSAYIFSRDHDEALKYNTLIQDQENFLRNYTHHSPDRGTSFNYQFFPEGLADPSFWNSDRVTGLKKRMTFLTGLPNVKREYINPYQDFVFYQTNLGFWKYKLEDEDGDLIFSSNNKYDSKEEAVCALETLFALGSDFPGYLRESGKIKIGLETEDGWSFEAIVPASYIAKLGGEMAVAQSLIEYFSNPVEVENFHVVEHILLRPREGGEPTLSVRTDMDCDGLNIEDPYSFKISVVLPTWAGRFQEIDFRRLFKKIMRMEAPAHVYIQFYWVDACQMYMFENCWATWLQGEWKVEQAQLLQESASTQDEDYIWQENSYELLLERGQNSGDEGGGFVTCMDELKNLLDAYYIMETPRIVDQYENCDLLAQPVDPDGKIIRAWVSEDSDPLPAGVCLHPCNGKIFVEDASLLPDDIDEFPLEIITLSSSGEETCHPVVIEFIPNGPAEIDQGPLNQHIGKYLNGDSLITFKDEDGVIIQATLNIVKFEDAVTGTLETAAEMPDGWVINPITGEITLADASLLEAGTYTFNVSLMDSEGGMTDMDFVIEIQPDQTAVAELFTPTDKNQDAYLQGQTLISISDPDGDITFHEMLQAIPSLANLGLAANIQTGKVVVTISNLAQFQTALPTWFNLIGNIYNFTFKIRTQDDCNGFSELHIPLTIRKDTLPEIVTLPARNADDYLSGETLCKIKDPVDSGLVNLSILPDQSALGMEVVFENNKIKVKVDDLALFQAAILNDFVPGTDDYMYSFPVDTVDSTGGLATVTALIKAFPDQEPDVVVTSPKNQDQYALTEEIAYLIDYDGLGIMSFSESNSNPFTLADLGLAASLDLRSALSTTVTSIFITNLADFLDAIDGGFYYSPSLSDPNLNLHKVQFDIDTVDYTGGKGTSTVSFEVNLDTDGNVISVTNGKRVDEYQNGDVLFRFTDPDGDVSSINIPALGSGLPGLGSRIVNGKGELYVTNRNLLQETSLNISVDIQDVNGGSTNLTANVSILKRDISISFALESMGPNSRLLDINSKSPGLFLTHLFPYPVSNFGSLLLFNSGDVYFSEGTGFATSNSGKTYYFDGLVNGTEVVQGSISISRKSKVRFGPGKINLGNNSSPAPYELDSGRKAAGASDDSLTNTLTQNTNRMLREVNNAKNYPDNPYLLANPASVGSYALGNKDDKIAGDMLGLMEDTSAEMVRLQAQVESKTGTEQDLARQDLELYTGIYSAQLLAAVEFAAEVRLQDVEEGSSMASLFTSINSQMEGFK